MLCYACYAMVWVGLDVNLNGLGWTGFKKMDLRPTTKIGTRYATASPFLYACLNLSEGIRITMKHVQSYSVDLVLI